MGRIQFDFRFEGHYRPTLQRVPSKAHLRRARQHLEGRSFRSPLSLLLFRRNGVQGEMPSLTLRIFHLLGVDMAQAKWLR